MSDYRKSEPDIQLVNDRLQILISESFQAFYTLKLDFTWTEIKAILCLNFFQLRELVLSEGSRFSEPSDGGLSPLFSFLLGWFCVGFFL